MRTITLEEHFATPAYMDGPGRQLKAQAERARAHPEAAFGLTNLVDRLCDLDDLRIRDMDAAGIDVQVLSITSPGTEQLPPAEAQAVARETNDALAAAVRRHPTRFAGFAALPMAVPDAAAAELERAIRQLGFRGAVINGHIQGRYLDDPHFWPVLECAQSLKAPIHLHPTQPPAPVVETSYTGNFSAALTAQLAIAGWGWHIETAIHVIRAILGGVFDRFPELQLIVGHLGEGLPFMLQRMDAVMGQGVTRLQRPIGAYLRENVHYTFSGFNYIPPFLNLLLEVGVERIMFSADYPYASMEEARAFLERLPVSPADRERIAHGNAERLLGL
ncbi:MAG TPA: amidohydrolase family protein [Bacillota bacterium]|nr:amidohydrolase family protein [Bacillota bacterium]